MLVSGVRRGVATAESVTITEPTGS
jgi:hypothetical protein